MALVPDLSIVIPAYNEEQRLERTVRDAVAYFRADGRAFELIVVDDGSRDHTSALVRRLSDELPEIERLESALADGAEVAVGSRALEARGVRVQAKLYRRVIGRTFHALVELLTVRNVKDTQCGFKLFRAPVAHDLFSRMRMNGFSFDVELLVMAARRGYRVAEVPVNWCHQPGSKVRLTVDSLRMAIDLFRIRKHCLSGEYENPHVARWQALREADPEPR